MTAKAPFLTLMAALAALALAGCTPKLNRADGGPYAPGVKRGADAVDGLVVGHRLMHAGEYELALSAFTRAAADQGMTNDIRLALGTANLGLGRLGQAETLLRKSVKAEPTIPEAWNNLGVVLMEKGEYAEAAQVFRRAYALDNGESDSVRDNLRKALAKSENPDYDDVTEQDYKLVRRGSSDFLIRRIP